MKRNDFDPRDDTPLPPHGAPPLENRLPCRACGTATLIATLSNYGARCFRCYEDYCREPTPKLGKQIRRPMQRSIVGGDDE
jgi:hypothetical protein